jgi:hypothetical protein
MSEKEQSDKFLELFFDEEFFLVKDQIQETLPKKEAENTAHEPSFDTVVFVEADGLISVEENKLLENILKSVGIHASDYEVVETSSLSSVDVLEAFSARRFFAFTTKPLRPFNLLPFEHDIMNNRIFIQSEPIAALQADKTKKTKLWKILKEVFDL